MALIEALCKIMESPSMLGLCAEVVVFLAAVWIAFLVGVIIGWTWKPQWVTINGDKIVFRVSKFLDSSLLSSPWRSLVSPLKGFPCAPCLNSLIARSAPDCDPVDGSVDKKPSFFSPAEFEDCSLVNEEDLEHLYNLVEMKDGGPPWIHMMERSTPGMVYEAWRRDPKTGPPQYRSRTVFEDASPEIVRDFFWDDEFRSKWDEMLASSTTVDVCPTTGTIVAQWVRKFPFFCSDREYIIGRRIWESDRTYYCLTKGVPYPSIPRRDKPRRVDLYYSSWRIRAVESKTGDGQMSACEVLLFHHEDMGIPWEIAKLGIRQGMWGTVKKFEPGLRAYQKARASGESLSQTAMMAQINTKMDPEFLRYLADAEDNLSETKMTTPPERPLGGNIPKLLIIGGAAVVACSIDRGLLTKAFIFGVARRFGNIGKKMQQVER